MKEASASPSQSTLEPPTKNEVWTAEEVAAYLRCSARHVTNMAIRGEIPARRFGSIWRFRRQDIVEFR